MRDRVRATQTAPTISACRTRPTHRSGARPRSGPHRGAVATNVPKTAHSAAAAVQTFTTRELLATKIRALYQRKKGRDLFDLWLALTDLNLPGTDLIALFDPYRPPGMTATRATANLLAKLTGPGFRTDLDPLIASWPTGYDIDTAADLVIAEILTRL